MSITIDRETGQLLKKRRVDLRFTHRDVAQKIGMSTGWMSQLENGKAPVKKASFMLLCECLEIDMKDILENKTITKTKDSESVTKEEVDMVLYFVHGLRLLKAWWGQ